MLRIAFATVAVLLTASLAQAHVTWKEDIKPGETAEFVFFAVNPKTPGSVAWKAHQRFADGTTADWTGVEGDRRPASVTRITAAPNTR